MSGRSAKRQRREAQLSVDEVRRVLKSLAAKGLISEANGIDWDDDPKLPRKIVLHFSPECALGLIDDEPNEDAA
jgi:hypothetical protein